MNDIHVKVKVHLRIKWLKEFILLKWSPSSSSSFSSVRKKGVDDSSRWQMFSPPTHTQSWKSQTLTDHGELFHELNNLRHASLSLFCFVSGALQLKFVFRQEQDKQNKWTKSINNNSKKPERNSLNTKQTTKQNNWTKCKVLLIFICFQHVWFVIVLTANINEWGRSQWWTPVKAVNHVNDTEPRLWARNSQVRVQSNPRIQV